MSQHTMESLIEHAIEFESKVRDLYIKLSGMFSHESRVSTFWRQFSDDESRHVNQLVEIRNTLSQEELSSFVENKEWASVLNVQFLLVPDWTVRIKSLNDAYELADKLENSEINAIFRFVIIKSVPIKERNMLLFSQIEKHLEKLIKFNQKYPEMRRKGICAKSVEVHKEKSENDSEITI